MSASLNELVEAQDALNAAIKGAVDDFLGASSDFVFNYCNIQNELTAESVRTVRVVTSVEADVDGARISRTSPKGM